MAECMFDRVLCKYASSVNNYVCKTFNCRCKYTFCFTICDETIMWSETSLSTILLMISHFPNGIFACHKFTKAQPFKSAFSPFLFFVLQCKHLHMSVQQFVYLRRSNRYINPSVITPQKGVKIAVLELKLASDIFCISTK